MERGAHVPYIPSDIAGLATGAGGGGHRRGDLEE